MKKGFSLLETLFVLFIMGILVGSLAGPFLRLSHKYQLKLAVWSVHSRMNSARYLTLFKGIKHRVVFGSDSIAVEAYDEASDCWVRETIHFVQGVTILANNSPLFLPQGTVTNLATIQITNTWGGYKITLAISGRIKAAPL